MKCTTQSCIKIERYIRMVKYINNNNNKATEVGRNTSWQQA